MFHHHKTYRNSHSVGSINAQRLPIQYESAWTLRYTHRRIPSIGPSVASKPHDTAVTSPAPFSAESLSTNVSYCNLPSTPSQTLLSKSGHIQQFIHARKITMLLTIYNNILTGSITNTKR